MHQVKIIAIRRHDPPRPVRDGFVHLADVDFEVGCIGFEGCRLMRTPAPKNGLTVWFPTLDKRHTGRIRFTDDALRAAVLFAVLGAYKAIGGTDAEWIPRATARDGDAGEVDADEAGDGVRRFLCGSETAR